MVSQTFWTFADGELKTPEGAWWTLSDAKPWLNVNKAMGVDPEVGKQVSEVLANFGKMLRTSQKSPQLVAAKNTLQSKGKGKGRVKGGFKGRPKKAIVFLQQQPSSSSPFSKMLSKPLRKDSVIVRREGKEIREAPLTSWARPLCVRSDEHEGPRQ